MRELRRFNYERTLALLRAPRAYALGVWGGIARTRISALLIRTQPAAATDQLQHQFMPMTRCRRYRLHRSQPKEIGG